MNQNKLFKAFAKTLFALGLFCLVEKWLASLAWWAAAAFAALVLCALSYNFCRRRIAKRRNPKDFAFVVVTEVPFFSDLPCRDRLRKEFPLMQEQEIGAWISDFEQVQLAIGRVAAAGGPKLLGEEFCARWLTAKFPFLDEFGLKRAVFETWHIAMHDGLDRNPTLKREELC